MLIFCSRRQIYRSSTGGSASEMAFSVEKVGVTLSSLVTCVQSFILGADVDFGAGLDANNNFARELCEQLLCTHIRAVQTTINNNACRMRQCTMSQLNLFLSTATTHDSDSQSSLSSSTVSAEGEDDDGDS